MRYLLYLSALLALAGCSIVAAVPATGLAGQVLRGPIEPVCRVDLGCSDEPFAAGFTVALDGRVVAAFRSDTEGRFLIHLRPGNYTVIPGGDAPILFPERQTRSVAVEPGELTEVTLLFDTGIR